MLLSVFDLDGTLITVNSSFSFFRFLHKKRICSSFFYVVAQWIRHEFFHLSLETLHRRIFDRILYGTRLEEFSRYAETFFSEYLIHFFSQNILEILHKARKEGHYILLLSSSPQFLIEPIARFLKVDEYKGTEYGIDKEGRFRQIDFLMNGEQKMFYVRSIADRLGIKRENISAYSDSHWDLPLLEEVSKSFVVRPNRILKKIAKRKGWKILI